MVMITPYFIHDIKTKGYNVIGVDVFLRKFAKICYDLKAPNAIGTMTTRVALNAIQIPEERRVCVAVTQKRQEMENHVSFSQQTKDKNSKDEVGVEIKTFD